jgi:hypothetical protein
MARLGLQLTEDFDVNIFVRKDVNGKIVSGITIADATYQNQSLLLLTQKGEWKEKPLVGVGLNNYLLDDGSTDELFREVASQFTADGMRVLSVALQDGKLYVDANYEADSSFR